MRWPNGSQTRPNISSPFGPRTAPTSGASTFHRGVDFTGCNPVRAIADGVVKYVGTPSGWSGGGRQVWIQHNWFYSRSMHMGSFSVSVGQRVSEGQILGSQDTTGTATGSHLHLEIALGTLSFSGGTQIDPVPFISARITGTPTGGASSDTRQLQLDLNTLGYPLEVDGDYGPATKAAVENFQRDNGLVDDGIAGPKTDAKIEEKIKEIQNLLVKVGYDITVDGASGPQTVGSIKDFQGKNGLTVDGIVGPKTRAKLVEKASLPVGYNSIPDVRSTVDVQRLVGANPDGIWGPETTEKVMAWQKAHNLTADGIWGPNSDAIGFPKAPSAFIPIDVDGKWGKATTTALQANLGFTGGDIDGELGPETIKALQAAIGIPEAERDGVIGPKTSKYLQSSLGVAIDGQIGPLTVTALQTLLNRSGKLQYVPFKDEDEQTPVVYPKPEKPTYPRAARWAHSSNSSKREGQVQLCILHHWGTSPIPSAESTWERFNRTNDRAVSPNVQINADGSAWEVVPADNFRAWTTGQIDHKAVTAEIQNSTVGPQWGISPEAHEEAAQFLAWASKRYNFPIQRGQVGPNNEVIKPGLIGHNETPAGKATSTVCPGPSLNYDWIVNRAKAINEDSPTPEPTDPLADAKQAWSEYKEKLAEVDTAFKKVDDILG